MDWHRLSCHHKKNCGMQESMASCHIRLPLAFFSRPWEALPALRCFLHPRLGAVPFAYLRTSGAWHSLTLPVQQAGPMGCISQLSGSMTACCQLPPSVSAMLRTLWSSALHTAALWSLYNGPQQTGPFRLQVDAQYAILLRCISPVPKASIHCTSGKASAGRAALAFSTKQRHGSMQSHCGSG